jgi:hypothetical protein
VIVQLERLPHTSGDQTVQEHALYFSRCTPSETRCVPETRLFRNTHAVFGTLTTPARNRNPNPAVQDARLTSTTAAFVTSSTAGMVKQQPDCSGTAEVGAAAVLEVGKDTTPAGGS